MALFKILKGNEANLPSTKHEGWAYVTEKGNMYVDLSNDKRVKIGNRADTAEYADKATGDTQTIRSRYLARIKQVTSDGTQFTFRGETGDGTNAPDLISIPLAGDKAGLISNAAQTIKGEKTFANGIKFPDVTSTTYPAVSTGLTWSGSTDGAKIYYEVQASDKGMLIIEARDDTNAGAIFRNSSSKKEVSIINGLVTGTFKGNLSGTASHATSDANGKNIASYVASVLAQSDNRTIRVTKGDGTTNDVKLYFAASSSFGGAANSANILNGYNEKNVTTNSGDGKIRYSYNVNNGTTGLFAATDNANGILTISRHGGNYYSQLGFSSNGKLYYRSFSNVALNTTTTWKQIAFTDTLVDKATQAEKDWLGQVIDETYMKYPLAINGEVITMTRGDGVSSTITVPDTKVTQSETTTANYRPIILGYTNTTDATKLSASTRNQVYISNKFYAQPSTGLLVATTFKGALDGNAKTATNAEFAEKAKGDTQSIQSKYVSSVLKKSGSNHVLRITKGDGTYNDVDLYFAGSSSCGGPANSANLLNTLGSKGSNSTTTGTYTKFATVNVSAGAWVNNSIFMFVSDSEANSFTGLIRIHFRSGSTIASTSISMYWLTISNRSYAGDMYAVKTADGVYDLYWYNRSSYMTLNFSVIRGGNANISFVSNSTVSSITFAAKSSLGGQVNYANSAGSATNDSAGESIRSTYIASIKQVTSNGTTFTFRGYAGDGTEKNNLISIPAASATIAGLVTNAAQTFAGIKTFKNNIDVKGKVTIDLNGNKVEIGSDNKSYFHFLVRGQAVSPLTFWFGGPIQSAGSITPYGHNTHDIGSAGNRWRAGYFGSGGINVGGTIVDKDANELRAKLFVSTIYANTSTGTSFIIGGKNSSGDEITTLTIPNASKDKCGLITNAAQGIWGEKTFNGKMIIISTGTSATTKSSTLRLSSNEAAAGGAVGMEFWRGTNASWQIVNDGGKLIFRNNYKNNTESAYNYQSLKLNYGTGAGSIPYLGVNGENTGYRLYVNGTTYIESDTSVNSGALRFNSSPTSAPGANVPTALSLGRLQGYGTFAINADTDGSKTEYLVLTSGRGITSTTSHGLAIGYDTITWLGNSLWTKYLMKTVMIDTSSLNVDTWYPVVIPLPYENCRIEIECSLNTNIPSWSTHTSGFTARKVWESNGSGWGTTSVIRRVLVSTYGFCDTDPIRGIGQLTNSSREYVYVRGGGKYRFKVSANVTGAIELVTASKTWSNQSIAPTTTVPPIILCPYLYTTVQRGSAYRLAYYDSAQNLNSTGHYASTTQIGINTTNTTNIGSHSLYVEGSAKVTNRLHMTNWIQFTDTTGLYSPNSGAGTHFYPNTTSSYGSYMIQGAKGGYTGFLLGPNTNYFHIMTNGTNEGLYNQSKGRWILHYHRTNDNISIGSSTSRTNYLLNIAGSTYIEGGLYVHTDITLNGQGANRLVWTDQNRKLMAASHYASATQIGICITDVSTIGSYSLFVNGTTKFNGNVTHNGITYFANGTTYYINNSADAHLNNVSIGGVNFGYKLYVSGGDTSLEDLYCHDTTINGFLKLYGSLNCFMPANFRDTVNIYDDAHFSGGAYFNNSVMFYDGVHANKEFVIGGSLTCNNQITVAGKAIFNGSLNVNNTSNLRNVKPQSNNTYNLGTSSLKWANVYATTFYGSLSGNASSSSFSSVSERLDSYDTRSATRTPQNTPRGITLNFKQNSTYGLSDGGSYIGLLSWRSYASGADLSGGYPIEIAYTANGNLWTRMGTSASAWGGWNRIIKHSFLQERGLYKDYGYQTNSSNWSSMLAVNQFFSFTNWWDSANTYMPYIYGSGLMIPHLDANYRSFLYCQCNAPVAWVGWVNKSSTNVVTWKRLWGQGDSVTSAVWNDYAECRKSDSQEPGYVMFEKGDDSLSKTIERLQHFAGIVSDTWGFSQGETTDAKTNIAVAGRVLAYPYRDRNEYKPGDCVCAAPGGKVDIMTREEIVQYPDRIVGTVSCVPEYEEWGGGEGADRDPVKVDGRIWIKVK